LFFIICKWLIRLEIKKKDVFKMAKKNLKK